MSDNYIYVGCNSAQNFCIVNGQLVKDNLLEIFPDAADTKTLSYLTDFCQKDNENSTEIPNGYIEFSQRLTDEGDASVGKSGHEYGNNQIYNIGYSTDFINDWGKEWYGIELLKNEENNQISYQLRYPYIRWWWNNGQNNKTINKDENGLEDIIIDNESKSISFHIRPGDDIARDASGRSLRGIRYSFRFGTQEAQDISNIQYLKFHIKQTGNLIGGRGYFCLSATKDPTSNTNGWVPLSGYYWASQSPWGITQNTDAPIIIPLQGIENADIIINLRDFRSYSLLNKEIKYYFSFAFTNLSGNTNEESPDDAIFEIGPIQIYSEEAFLMNVDQYEKITAEQWIPVKEYIDAVNSFGIYPSDKDERYPSSSEVNNIEDISQYSNITLNYYNNILTALRDHDSTEKEIIQAGTKVSSDLYNELRNKILNFKIDFTRCNLCNTEGQTGTTGLDNQCGEQTCTQTCNNCEWGCETCNNCQQSGEVCSNQCQISIQEACLNNCQLGCQTILRCTPNCQLSCQQECETCLAKCQTQNVPPAAPAVCILFHE